MVNVDEMDIDKDAKHLMEDIAEQEGFDLSQLQIPKKKLEQLFEAFSEDEFKRALEQAFKQLD